MGEIHQIFFSKWGKYGPGIAKPGSITIQHEAIVIKNRDGSLAFNGLPKTIKLTSDAPTAPEFQLTTPTGNFRIIARGGVWLDYTRLAWLSKSVKRNFGKLVTDFKAAGVELPEKLAKYAVT